MAANLTAMIKEVHFAHWTIGFAIVGLIGPPASGASQASTRWDTKSQMPGEAVAVQRTKPTQLGIAQGRCCHELLVFVAY